MKINILNRIKKGIIDAISLNKKANKEDDTHTPKGVVDQVQLWSGRITQVLTVLIGTGLIAGALGDKLLSAIQPVSDLIGIIYSIIVT